MNKVRRKSIEEIMDKLDELINDLEMLRDEEQEYMDNMPESLQSGEKYDAAESAVGSMDEAIDSIGSAVTSLEEASQ